MAGSHQTSPKMTKGSFSLHWLYAVRDAVARDRDLKGKERANGLKDIDLSTAADALQLIDENRMFFRSAASLAKALNCSANTASSSLGRLQRAGFFVKTQDRSKRFGGGAGGRPANTFRLVIPEVSPKILGESEPEVSPEFLGKTSAGVSPKGSGEDLPKTLGTNTIDDPMEDAGARFRARPASKHTDDPVITEIEDDGRAPEGAPITSDHIPIAAEGRFDDDLSDVWDLPIPELDAESGAAQKQSLIREATASMFDLHGDALADPGGFVVDLFAGYAEGDNEAADRATQVAASMLLDAMLGNGKCEARRKWAAHSLIVRDIFSEYGVDSDATWELYSDHVGRQGKAMEEARRAKRAGSKMSSISKIDLSLPVPAARSPVPAARRRNSA